MNQLDINKGLKRIYEIHDIDVNQRYGDYLPYSFHLECVVAQGMKFKDLILPHLSMFPASTALAILSFALAGHDLKEDARHTYNDLIALGEELGLHRAEAVVFADIVWSVSDSDGKTRAERKDDLFYAELITNAVGVGVKLADMSANRLFSKLTVSNQYNMYVGEFGNFRRKVEHFHGEYVSFFDYIEAI